MKLNLTLPNGELPVTGKQVTYISPLPCDAFTHLVIGGYEFRLVDSNKVPISDFDFAFNEKAVVSVILSMNHDDSGENLAFLQNGNTNSYIESVFAQIQEDLAKTETWRFTLEDGSTVEKVVRLSV